MVEVTADLRSLAEMIIRLSNEHGSTPVIVMPKHLSLRPPFFIELAKELTGQMGKGLERQIRFDWCLTPKPFFASTQARLAQFRSARLTRQLASAAAATVEVTASIGRPGGQHRDLVVGLCHETLDLPPWTTAIRIQ